MHSLILSRCIEIAARFLGDPGNINFPKFCFFNCEKTKQQATQLHGGNENTEQNNTLENI